MAPRSLLIIGNYGAGNLGDDAILGGIVQECRSLGFGGEIMVTHGGKSTSPEIYKGLKKVPFVPAGLRSRWTGKRKEAFDAISRADLVILGGGGLFTDTESWKAPYIWFKQAQALQKMKKPYLCYGQSIGPLTHWWSRHWAKKCFRHALGVHVRDEASAKLLKEWGIPCSVGTDPALSWLFAEKRTLPKKPILLLSLRSWPGFLESAWKPILKEVQVYSKRKGLKPILLSMQAGEELKAPGFELYQPNGARAALEAFEKAEAAVTMRLHAGIFSLAAGTPFFALAYSEKVKSFFKPYVTTLELFTEDSVRQALKNLKKCPVNLEKELLKNQAFLEKYLR